MNMTAATLVAGATARVRTLSPGEFAEQSDRSNSVMIDVREADERVRQGSIRGAVHIPRGLLEFRADVTSMDFDERLQRDRQLLLYCHDGGRSALAAETLITLGYADVAHLQGGIRAWIDASLPLYGRQVDPY
jgi:rhodanese-related sulfurtransferase